MKRKPELLMKGFSGLVSMAMVASAVLSVPVMAEEYQEETWAAESMAESDIAEDTAAEDAARVYVISDFKDFHKTEDGKFADEEMEKKYGDFKAVPGTSLEQLDLPDKLVLEGYWQADGTAETLTLEDVEWKLKSDKEEEYSEVSPEGSYTFVPDLDAYLLTSEEIDEFIYADESVKLPQIELTVTSQTEEGTSGEEGAPEEGGQEETAAEADPVTGLPVEGQTESTEAGQSDTSNPEEEADVPSGEADASTDENIFDGLDDSILDGEGGEVEVYGETDGTVQTEAVPQSETQPSSDGTVAIPQAVDVPVETQETQAAQTEAPAAETEAPVAETAAPESESAATPDTAVTEAVSEDAPVDPAQDVPAAAATAEVNISVSDVNGNELYRYTDAEGNLSLTLTADEEGTDHTVTVPAITGLSCGADLSTLVIGFYGTGDSADKTYALAEIVNGEDVGSNTWNFSGGAEKTFHVTEYKDGVETGNKYTVKFEGIAQNGHTPGNDASCIQDATCTVCGATIPGTMTAHQFTPATCTEPEKCVVCGTIGAAAKGHTWKEATCTTPKTCSVCGATEGEALGHDWKAATCTEPKTCERCGATKGKALGHDMSNDWQTIANSTDTTHGTQIRYCSRDCGYYEERQLNIIGSPDNNAILNLAEGGQYNLNTKITFTASGAAMGNSKPIDGDVRYVPLSWSIQGTPGTFMDGFTGAFSITKAGSYTVTVVFQKQVYEDGSWKATDVSDSRSVNFTVGNLVQGELVGTSDGIRINPQTGDSTPIVPMVIALVAAVVVIVGALVFRKKKK